MLLPSCVRRTTIPDDELALIFRDAFLANAYLYESKLNIDSLQIYSPIFERYGYTAEDVAYTAGSFSTRKSARLSDIVESAIKLLQAEDKHYKTEVQILDTIDVVARRFSKERYFHRDYIEYFAEKDTVDLYFQFDSLMPGEYFISFDYLIDSLDNNRSNYRFVTWVEGPDNDDDSEKKTKQIRKGLSTSYLRKKYVSSLDRTIKIDTLTHKLFVHLAESYELKRKPHLSFRNVIIDYIPPTDEAVDNLFKKSLDVRIFSNDIFGIQPQDSLELSTL